MPLLMLLLAAALSLAAQQPPQFEIQMQQGITALGTNRLAEAQSNFEQATRLQPGNAAAWLLLAQAFARQKNSKPALAAAQKAETLGAASPAILHELAMFYVDNAPQDFGKAATLESNYAEKNPADIAAWRRAAELALRAGKPDEAIAAGTKALAVDDSADLHSVLGEAYARTKNWPRAVSELSTAIKLGPYDEERHFRLAQVYLFQQDFSSAAAVLENARKTFDKSAQLELALGVAYYGERKFTEAVAQFLHTMQLAPDVPQPYAFLGRILDHATDRLPEVTARFAEFEARNPKSYIGYALHAKAIIAQLPPSGDPPEVAKAFALLEKSLALEPRNPEAHLQLGILLDRKGDFAGAATHLEKSIELNPNEAAAHFRLARVYDRLGRKEDAVHERALHEKLNEQEGGALK